MVQLSNYNFVKNVNFTVLLKIFTFILTWTYLSYNDVGTFSKSLERIYEHDKIWYISFCRLLARYEQKREVRDTRFKDKLPDRGLHKNKRNVSDHIPTYSEVCSNASKKFDIYMKGYKDRYMKKKGLYKLDCYYENKLFGKFNHMCDIAEKMRNNKKRWKRFFFKKYGIGLIIFALLPSLGLIFHIFFGVGEHPGIYGLCKGDHFNKDSNNNITTHNDTLYDGQICPKKWLYDQKHTIETYGYISYIYMFTLSMIVFLFVIYTLMKFIKYERLKAEKI